METTAYERFQRTGEVPTIYTLSEDITAARALLEHLGFDCDDYSDLQLYGIYSQINMFVRVHKLSLY